MLATDEETENDTADDSSSCCCLKSPTRRPNRQACRPSFNPSRSLAAPTPPRPRASDGPASANAIGMHSPKRDYAMERLPARPRPLPAEKRDACAGCLHLCHGSTTGIEKFPNCIPAAEKVRSGLTGTDTKHKQKQGWAQKAGRVGVRLPWSVTWSVTCSIVPPDWQPYLVTHLPTHPQSLPCVPLCFKTHPSSTHRPVW